MNKGRRHNEKDHDISERRSFFRIHYQKPLNYRVVSTPDGKNPISSTMNATSKNLSASGIYFLTKINKIPMLSSIIMIDVDHKEAEICRELECHAVIKDDKVCGKVMRIEDNKDGTCGVGISFVTKSDFRV